MKFLTKSDLWPILLILLALIFGVFQLPHLPDQVPSHWNWKGEVDDYSSKTFIVFLFPILTIGIYLFLSFIPFIDPLRENFDRFPRVFYWIKFSIVILMLAVYAGLILTARGIALDMVFLVQMLVALVIIFLGAVMGKIRKNYFVGIRVPWTLANEEVWDRTHKLGGLLFILAGLLSIMGALLKAAYFWVILLISVLTAILVATVYSYIIFEKLKKQMGESFERV